MPQFACPTCTVYTLCLLGRHRNVEVSCSQGSPPLPVLQGLAGKLPFPNLDSPGGGGAEASSCFYSESES